MTIYTTTFSGIKASAAYTCPCATCGKPLSRKATVEHTVNPFNKNDDGTQKTSQEVRCGAYAAAEMEAARLQGVPATCRDCEDAPNRALLLEMALAPDREFPEPARFWGSAMQVLAARKHVERTHDRCDCGAACCSGYISRGYRLTAAGRKRATALQATPQAAGDRSRDEQKPQTKGEI